eukprot:scaffold78230_cov61-Attheya_sp.AAC.1
MPPPVVLTADEFLMRGLTLCGFTVNRQLRSSRETNLERFKSLFGSLPHIYTQIWEDLIYTDIPEIRIGMDNVKRQSPAGFLVAINFLKTYQTETAKSGYLNMTEKTMRKWIWYYCPKIQALKAKRINEPIHPILSKKPKYYSHKFKHAGLNYKIGISVFDNKVVSLNGPFRAGKGDLDTFQNHGLKDKIPADEIRNFKGRACLMKDSAMMDNGSPLYDV